MIWDILPAGFIAQYAATFRPFGIEEARKEFKAYCLFDSWNLCEVLWIFHTVLQRRFQSRIHNIPGLAEDFCLTTLREFIGFAASAMLGRICDLIPYPDYDDIDDYVQRHNAKCFSIILNREMLVKWESYNSIDEFIQDILTIEEIYCRNIKDLKL